MWLDRWPVGDVVAYSLHRFVREWVRASQERRDFNAISCIESRVNDFVDNYEKGGGPELPPDFIEHLNLRIAAMALTKLTNITVTALNVRVDEFDRSRETKLAEAGKFLAFLREASNFRNLRRR
jgi:hypothetical protein